MKRLIRCLWVMFLILTTFLLLLAIWTLDHDECGRVLLSAFIFGILSFAFAMADFS